MLRRPQSLWAGQGPDHLGSKLGCHGEDGRKIKAPSALNFSPPPPSSQPQFRPWVPRGSAHALYVTPSSQPEPGKARQTQGGVREDNSRMRRLSSRTDTGDSGVTCPFGSAVLAGTLPEPWMLWEWKALQPCRPGKCPCPQTLLVRQHCSVRKAQQPCLRKREL